MADDIDIEEHDVLENPAIRNIFPDISVIKKEISQYYEDELTIKQEPELANVVTEESVSDTKIDNSGRDLQEKTATINRSSEVTNNIYENQTSASNNDKYRNNYQGTKIILGSKPNKAVVEPQSADIVKSQNISLASVVRIPKVLVQDLGEYIYQSSRYCNHCRTLFPSTPDFNDHKIKLHSIKPQNKTKTVKRQVKSDSVEKSNKCNICGTSFSCRSSLYRHYRIDHQKSIRSKVNNTKFKPHVNVSENKKINLTKNDSLEGPSNKNATRRNRLHVKVTLIDKVANENIKKDNNTVKQSLFKAKCVFCGLNYSSKGNLTRHYKNVHKKKPCTKIQYKNGKSFEPTKKISSPKSLNKEKNTIETKANNTCFHCNEQFFDKKCLIEHIYTVLEQKKNSKQQKNNTLITNNTKKSSESKILEGEDNINKENRTRLRDKLMFENQDSDENESCLSQIKMKEVDTTVKCIPNKKMSINLKKDQSESMMLDDKFPNDVTSQILDHKRHGQETVRNKRTRAVKNDDTKERQLSPQYHPQNKKSKVGDIDSSEVQLKKKDIVSKEQCKDSSDDESDNIARFSPKPLKDKFKYDLSDNNSTESNCSDKGTLIEDHVSPELESRDNKPKRRVNNKKNKKSSLENCRKQIKQNTSQKQIKTNKMVSKNRCIAVKNETHNKRMVGSFVYECIYCSYIFPSVRGYSMHMFLRHNLIKVSRPNKVIFEKQCKYCPSTVAKRNRNSHVRKRHYNRYANKINDYDVTKEEKETTKSNSVGGKKIDDFVLKSIIYRCAKCDIHFLSSSVAKDHENHMELLINWKCRICEKIFKKHDKKLHQKQHEFSKTVNVCHFDESELSKLIYNCTKCAIHFTEERYLEHYPKCDYETPESVYCKACDILIDKCGYIKHKDFHKIKNNTTDLIVITGDIITQDNVEKVDKVKNSYSLVDKYETKTTNNGGKLYSPMNCLTFCQTCKCYLSDIAINRKSHVEGKCSKMVKYTCPTCGLVFTNKTINTHRDHHKKQKELKLQDFEFFDLKGIQIRPPIPEYPSCNNCEVTFVGKNAVINHVCSETEHFTCEICKLKLSENAFKLHMNFHNYRMPAEKVNRGAEIVTEDPHHKNDVHENRLVTITLSNTIPSDTDNFQTELQDFNAQVKKNTIPNVLCDTIINEKSNNLVTIEENKTQPEESNPKTDDTTRNVCQNVTNECNTTSDIIIYSCYSCKMSVDTYDKVIHHCQNHYDPDQLVQQPMKTCLQCSLWFDSETYENHEKLHLNSDTMQVVTFDHTYFTSENRIWTHHVFASLSSIIQRKAIEKSMYQHECRIKMEVVQQGPYYLSVYKCYKCGIFLNSDCLMSHVMDGCQKVVGKHPCTMCGLPYSSNLARTKHEKIHRQYDNVRLKSYNIIVINCKHHSNYNASIIKSMKQYVLYQCRKCDGIVDKPQLRDHKCNMEILRKCQNCELLLHKDDIERHTVKHSDLPMFTVDNIKVVLFGNNDESLINKCVSSTFKGLIDDYKVYKCRKCGDCENDKNLTSRHLCTFDDSKWKCPKCSYYISARSIKLHIEIHDVYAELTPDTFAVELFGSTINEPKNKKDCPSILNALDYKDQVVIDLDTHAKINNNSTNNLNSDQNISPIIFYKCTCGLHYMNEGSAKNHAKLCCPKMKIIRQKCSKCSLTFNPKELFSHILAHHGDKNKTFKYDVIDVKVGNASQISDESPNT